MAKTGTATLTDATVTRTVHDKAVSVLVATKDTPQGKFTITIERVGLFPAGMDLRPDDTIDVVINYSPKVAQ
jgi:hypothetical protein